MIRLTDKQWERIRDHLDVCVTGNRGRAPSILT